MMTGPLYTHAMWRVSPGKEMLFIEKWTRLAEAFAALPGKPLWGTLIRSRDDRSLFYSFGPWRSADDVAAMRASEPAQRALRELRELCDAATPASFELVKHVDVP
jgi:heme-degrading monooxygenase HmoA